MCADTKGKCATMIGILKLPSADAPRGPGSDRQNKKICEQNIVVMLQTNEDGLRQG
ncbi:hypothetical protein RCCS2_07544 [Roseobacter sp. CCS2]|nr:hypothetical protein RCCS2_07544 [Roseobacter sp. CCS2]